MEFQTLCKKPEEGWADFAQDLQILVEKAFPNLQAEAREQMVMKHYLSQTDNAQLAFSVKQQKPSNLDAAVTDNAGNGVLLATEGIWNCIWSCWY